MDAPMSEYGTNLWLEITGVSNGEVWFNLHNATNQVYAISSTTNLLANWNVELELWPDTNQIQTVLPFTVPTLERQSLFLQAEDWTDVDSDGDGIPDWWMWKYFGSLAETATNLDSQGNTLLSDYQNGFDPNVISFTFWFTNQYADAFSIPVQLSVTKGVPGYYAVLVNDDNQADANWLPYTSSNITVNLGSTDGVYNVAIGLRGLPADAQQTWQTAQLALDATPLAVVLTNPPANVVAQSTVQLEGYVVGPLASLSFDVSNAAGLWTNQRGFFAGQFYDLSSSLAATNYFQCPDLDLQAGGNVITFHAADRAGNTTSVSFILDYAPTTNAPSLAVIWPQDGTQISDHSFTVQAQTDDNTSAVTAVIMDGNGNTNTAVGLVERDGTIWVRNLPLASGANQLALTLTNGSGSSTTNLTVYQSSVLVTVNPLTSDQLNQSSVTVYGTVSDATAQVLVNGVQATVSDDGTWEADGVSVSATGAAVLDVEAYAASQSQSCAASCAGRGQTFRPQDASDPDVLGLQRLTLAQPPTVTTASYYEHDAGSMACPIYNIIQYRSYDGTINWLAGFGGSDSAVVDNNPPIDGVGAGAFSYPIGSDACGYAWENENMISSIGCGSSQYQIQTQVKLVASGQEPAGQTNTYLVLARPSGLSPEELQINQQTLVNTGITNDDGSVWGAMMMQGSAGKNVDVTPTLIQSQQYWYTFDVQVLDITHILAVDNNRDGQISLDGSDNITAAKPFRFWINDSTESGDIVSGSEKQIPGQSPVLFNGQDAVANANYAHAYVNGRSDLINFFPVALNLGNLFQWLPPTNGFEYHLIQNDSAVKFVYTGLTLTNAFDYLTNTVATNGYGTNFVAAMTNFDEAVTNADTIQVPNLPPGVLLDTNWLAWVQTNNGGTGIILVEGCTATTKPLWLEIWKDGKLLGGTPLYLSITNVEAMFRHLNLRDGPDAPADANLAGDLQVRNGDASLPSQTNEPANYPDTLYNQWFFAEHWFIFVVGSNVGGQNARGWESEVFKRMYWSGNKAKFVGVSWFGDPYTNGEGVYDYHMAVRNAFATAPSLASFVNGLSGNKTIAGHSLSCGLIASAIADYGMNINNACLMDAAFAQECFDGDADDNLTAMRPAAWQDYPQELWAAHWHELFTDTRWYLTWRNRFAGAIGKVYNFYSSTEDALGEYDGELPVNAMEAYITSGGNVEAYVWTYQEKAKGNRRNYYVPFYPGHFHCGSTYGGWGFNLKDPLSPDDPVYYDFISFPDVYRTNITSAEASSMLNFGTINNDVLQRHPFFEPGWGVVGLEERLVNQDAANFCGPDWIMGLYTTPGGNTIAADRAKRSQLLAEAIPALSLPVGANPCQNNALLGKQFDMATQFADSAHWDSIHGKTVTGTPKWWHSDMDQAAYPFIYGLYNQLVSISNQ